MPALDQAETGHFGFGLAHEAVVVQQFAFERGEKAAAHGVVVSIPDRTHGWAHARFPVPLAERERGILAPLVAVVNDVAGSALADRC